MKDKITDYWKKTKDLRQSLPNLIRPRNVFKDDSKNENEEEKEDDRTLTQKINQNMLKYKEIKLIYNKTGVPPAYFLYGLVVCLVFIFIGYFESYLTHLIATLYPMYISIKTLQNQDATKEDITQWLTYW